MDNNLKKHIYFSGSLSSDPEIDQKRKEMFRNMMATIIENSRFLYTPEYYTASTALVEADMLNLDYCLDLYPSVNASVDIYHNRIIMNLFSFLAANRMTILDGLLDLLIQSQQTSFTQANAEAEKWASSYNNILMIDEYIQSFSLQQSDFQNWPYIDWSKKATFLNSKYACYTYPILQMFFLHEFGHWQYARFNPQKKQEFFSFAYGSMLKRYSEDFLSTNKQMTYAWVEEIIADYIALIVYTYNNRQFGEEKQCTRDCYVVVGLFYGLMALEELARNLNFCSTHPPAFVRQEIVMELFGNFLKPHFTISQEIFQENEVLEWRVIQEYFSRIIEEYKERKHGKAL